MRGIYWLAANPVSFSRMTLLNGVSKPWNILSHCSLAVMQAGIHVASVNLFHFLVRAGAITEPWIPDIMFALWILISQVLSVSAIWDGGRRAVNWLLDRVQLELKVCCVEAQKFSLRTRLPSLTTAPRCVMSCCLVELYAFNSKVWAWLQGSRGPTGTPLKILIHPTSSTWFFSPLFL